MKPNNLSEVKSQDEFLVYLIDNYYHILGEEHNSRGVISSTDRHSYWISVNPDGTIRLEEQCRSDSPCHLFDVIGKCVCLVTQFKDYKDMIAKLRNKPSFEDHPDAKCFAQCESGMWCKNTESSDVEPVCGWWATKARCAGWVNIQRGQVIGDWKNSFEKAPEKIVNTTLVLLAGEVISSIPVGITCKEGPLSFRLVNTTGYAVVDCYEKLMQAQTIETLEQQIQGLKTENQELKTKLDRIKQSLV